MNYKDIEYNLNNVYQSGDAINTIKSSYARNLLRGMISSSTNYHKLLLKIEKQTNLGTVKQTIQIIRSNIFFDKNTIARDYPTTFMIGYPLQYIFTEKEVVSRIQTNSKSLLLSLSIIQELYILLNRTDYKGILDKSEELYEICGVSIFLLKFLFVIRKLCEDSSDSDAKEIVVQINKKLNSYGIKKIRKVDIAIKELTNPRTDYFLIVSKIKEREPEDWADLVIKSFVQTVPKDYDDYLNILNGYYGASLLDSLLYILYLSNFSLPYLVKVEENFENDLYLAYSNILNITLDLNTIGFNSYDFFRWSFTLSENLPILKYFSIHNSLQSKNENKFFEISGLEQEWISKYFESVCSLENLSYSNIDSPSINLDSFDSSKCTRLENSSALVYVLKKINGIGSDDDLFIKLMSCTSNIGEILPNYILQQLFSQAQGKLVLQLVILCLQTIKSQSDSLDFKLRKIIQRLIAGSHKNDLISFLDALYEKSPAVAEHLVQICDEKFLSLFFYTTSTPTGAIENRAKILEWYGEKIDDNLYIEKSKNLRIDIQIIKEKGTIDDARIYVDPYRFNQWVSDNSTNQMALYLDAIMEQYEFIVLTEIDWLKVKTGLSPLDNLAMEILSCYETFCCNNIFGIASYLGRRIRHGTLEGTALKDLKEFIKQEKFEVLFENHNFRSEFETWLQQYTQNINSLIHEYLHIYAAENKPTGLIKSSIGDSVTKVKHANVLLTEVFKSYKKNRNMTEIPFLINDFCWRSIEIELKKVREFINQNKKIFDISNISVGKGEYCNSLLHHFKSEVNSIVNEKFRVMSSWFNKPSIASPETDIVLLFNAVISGVKDSVSGFNPQIRIDASEYRISGGMYFIIYDALYIIVDNVAKHGNASGEISFDLETLDKKIRVVVKSHCKLDEDFDLIKNKINGCLKEYDDDAYLIEGNSGIKKLKKLETDNYIKNVKYDYIENSRTIITSFDFILGYQI